MKSPARPFSARNGRTWCGNKLASYDLRVNFQFGRGSKYLILRAVILKSNGVTQLADAKCIAAMLRGCGNAVEMTEAIARVPALQGLVQVPLEVVKGKGSFFCLLGGGLVAAAVSRKAQLEDDSTCSGLHVLAQVFEGKIIEIDEQAGKADRECIIGIGP